MSTRSLPAATALPAGRNVHAGAVLLGARGILILGPSGSGKSTLALSLIGSFRSHGRFARLVGDDQLFVEALSGRLLVTPAPTIAGLAEVYGLGPTRLPFARAAVIDLVVRLVDPAQAPRLAEEAEENVCGIRLPRLDLPARNTVASAPAVAAWLEMRPGALNCAST